LRRLCGIYKKESLQNESNRGPYLVKQFVGYSNYVLYGRN
jgi:hypothetical protein